MRLVVVVLPFDPVMAMIGTRQNHDATSISEKTWSPLRAACWTMLTVEGTPGLMTIRSGGGAVTVPAIPAEHWFEVVD